MKNAKMKKLNLNELEAVHGGYIFGSGEGTGKNPDAKWESIDDKTGDVLGRFVTRAEAKACAAKHNMSTDDISWNCLKKLREDWHDKFFPFRIIGD